MAKTPKRMQQVSFRQVDDLLDFLPPAQLAIVAPLREMVFECIPAVTEKLSFNVPFYRRERAICFIWPGAVDWNGKTWEGVELGFNYGNLLLDETGFLAAGQRKQVFSRRFTHTIQPAEESVLRELLFQAAELATELAVQAAMRKK